MLFRSGACVSQQNCCCAAAQNGARMHRIISNESSKISLPSRRSGLCPSLMCSKRSILMFRLVAHSPRWSSDCFSRSANVHSLKRRRIDVPYAAKEADAKSRILWFRGSAVANGFCLKLKPRKKCSAPIPRLLHPSIAEPKN